MMQTRARMQAMAKRMVNQTFGDFRDPVVLTELGTQDYDTQVAPILATDNTFGIRVEFNKNQVDGKRIQTGDFKILILQQDVTIDVRSDNTNLVFNGKAVSIQLVSEDAARAIYTIHARTK